MSNDTRVIVLIGIGNRAGHAVLGLQTEGGITTWIGVGPQGTAWNFVDYKGSYSFLKYDVAFTPNGTLPLDPQFGFAGLSGQTKYLSLSRSITLEEMERISANASDYLKYPNYNI